MFGTVTALEGLHVTEKYRDTCMQPGILTPLGHAGPLDDHSNVICFLENPSASRQALANRGHGSTSEAGITLNGPRVVT